MEQDIFLLIIIILNMRNIFFSFCRKWQVFVWTSRTVKFDAFSWYWVLEESCEFNTSKHGSWEKWSFIYHLSEVEFQNSWSYHFLERIIADSNLSLLKRKYWIQFQDNIVLKMNLNLEKSTPVQWDGSY